MGAFPQAYAALRESLGLGEPGTSKAALKRKERMEALKKEQEEKERERLEKKERQEKKQRQREARAKADAEKRQQMATKAREERKAKRALLEAQKKGIAFEVEEELSDD